MSNNIGEYQVALFLFAEEQSTKEIIADKLVKEFGFKQKISLEAFLKNLAKNNGIFNIPESYLTTENIDKQFPSPVLAKEMHVRRILGQVGLSVPVNYNFNPNRIAISNFIFPKLNTGREVLEYIAFDVLNKVNPDFIPVIAYDKFIGIPGIYVVDDLKTQHELAVAKNSFQLIYTAAIDSKRKKKKEDLKQIVRSEIDWDVIECNYLIVNEYDNKKTDDNLLEFVSKFNNDINQRIKNGNINPLPKTTQAQAADWKNSKGPIGQSVQAQKEFTSGKANFVKGNMETMLTPNDRIRDYHVRGQY